MLIERSLHPKFLSNTYLVADGEGGPGFFVDAGGPVAPLIEAAKRLQIEPTHVLLTHHHFDHVSEVGALCKRWPKLKVLAHPLEREALAEMGDVLGKGIELGTIDTGEILGFGQLEVRPLKTPGHTAGMLSLLVSEASTAAQVQAAAGAMEWARARAAFRAATRSSSPVTRCSRIRSEV